MIEWLRFVSFGILSICIAVIDFKIKKIPDTLLLILSVILLCIDAFMDYRAIPYRLLAAIAAYGLFFIVYRFKGGLGYGDVKYAGVIGYFLGPWRVLIGLFCAVLLGLIYWTIGNLALRWGKEKHFSFGPWLGCGAIAAELLFRRVF